MTLTATPDSYEQVTIKPMRNAENAPFRYRVMVDGDSAISYTESGDYNTLEGAFASFVPALRPEFQAWIIEQLKDDEPVTFSLKDACDWESSN